MIQHVEVCRRLEGHIERHGSLRKAALALKVSPQYLSAVLGGKRLVGRKLLKSLRLRRTIRKVVMYEELPGARARA